MVITSSLLQRVAELERQRDVLRATIHASHACGCYHVFGEVAEDHDLPRVEADLDRMLFAMLAIGIPLEVS